MAHCRNCIGPNDSFNSPHSSTTHRRFHSVVGQLQRDLETQEHSSNVDKRRCGQKGTKSLQMIKPSSHVTSKVITVLSSIVYSSDISNLRCFGRSIIFSSIPFVWQQ
eukprot:Protomagalhaensia_wolfi_Nauph_80__1352@NODE_1806_length_1326_cov_2059_942502_g1409_i0_p1_GENE_NODE_1806_length_1326_cov_2059_942502_g1409_i0NODE_1806_length_1326_cov_2059_942502_g1409_i0_p1_ORF_typecomplete_len107_score5_51Goodbye/PF17109_5/0_097_NODE_1806_length_1326_cov_2059_942502_g1409_i08441164